MKVLIVASYNKGYFAPFIVEQAEALRSKGCQVDFYGVSGKGIKGYLRALPELRKAVKIFKPDVVHAHYGLSGLLACFQRRVPVITTFHGSDINDRSILCFSRAAERLSAFSIFVSQKCVDIAKPVGRFALVPCGIDITDLQLTEKKDALRIMGLSENHKYVLFSGRFNNAVKNYPLAKEAIDLVPGAELVELYGYTREQVTLLMCAADAILMTSFTEGSPQVIKESMACGLPVVSVDVGDVKELTQGIKGCFITNRDPDCIAGNILKAMSYGRTNGRDRIVSRNLDNATIAGKIIEIYNSVV